MLFGKGKDKNTDLGFEDVEFEDLEDGNFKTEGDLDEAELNRIESELRDEANRIDWGSDSNRIPPPSGELQPAELYDPAPDAIIRPAEVLNPGQ